VRFEAIRGHDAVRARLRRATEQPATAYLLYGPDGIGKRRLADAFTARLLCTAPADHDVCGTCAQCTRLEAGTHPDRLVIEKDADRRDIRTEQARGLTRWLGLRPMMAIRKVVIVDGAHQLNAHGQNALLKTLEEPPGDAVIVLVASGLTQVLPTVRSRCQQLRLDPLPAATVAAALADHGHEPNAARGLAARAGGSIGRALLLADADHEALRGRVLEMLARLPEATAAELSSLASDAGRAAPESTLEVAISWYRDLLGLVLGGDDDGLRNPDAAAPLAASATRLDATAILRALERICDTLTALSRNANRVLSIETMLLSLRRLERDAAAIPT